MRQVSDKLCECGCGCYTLVSEHTDPKRGAVRGSPNRYIRGHATKKPLGSPPSRLCACGCGGHTTIITGTDPTRGRVRGERNKYLYGHSRKHWTTDGDPYTIDEETGCWIWQGSLDEHGYGNVLGSAYGTKMAHRAVYLRLKGPIPDGWHLHHKCKNPPCVNPDHLQPLSRTEHLRAGGKLSLVKARQIRQLEREGMSKLQIAKRFEVSPRTIVDVVKGKTWQEPKDVEWIRKPFAEALAFARANELAVTR